MFLPFLNNPLLINGFMAALILGALGGLLSPFIISRRLSFFGDTLSHTLLTGLVVAVVIGFVAQKDLQSAAASKILAFGIEPTTVIIFITALILSLLMHIISLKLPLSPDTAIMFIIYLTLAAGVFLIGLGPEIPEELLENFLFGSLDGVTYYDLRLLIFITILVFSFLLFNIKRFLLSTWEPDIAKIAGIKVGWFNYCFLVILSLTAAIGITVVGNLLLGAMFILPAAAAKNLTKSFTGFLWLSIIIGFLSGLIGYLLASPLVFNTFPGSTIIMTAISLFFVTLGLKVFTRIRV